MCTPWQTVAREEVPHEGVQMDNTFASGSPVTDGKCVVAYFGSRGLHCYDMQGNLKWEKDFGVTPLTFGSPFFLKIGVIGCESSYLILILATGNQMLRLIPGRGRRGKKSDRRSAKTQAARADRPWRHPSFEVLEDRAMLSVAQDLQNEIAPYQNAINTALQVATRLPLVGHQFDGLQEINTLLQNSLASIEAQTQNVTSGHYQIAVTLPTISHTFTFDLGLNSFLQVSTAGGVAASITPTLNIGFNFNGTSPSLDTANTNLDLGFGLSLPNFQATLSLNHLLYTHAVDQGTNFNGHLKFGFASDGSVTPQFSGDAHIKLGLTLSFVDPALGASFNPTFRTDFQLDWSIDSSNNGLMTPQIALKNFGLDADSFLHGFIGDIAKTVQRYTKPLQPFIDKFDTPVPILSAFDSSETIGDLLLQGAGLSPELKDRFNLMVKVIKAVNTLDLSGSTGGATIRFGDINLTGLSVTGDGQLGSAFGFDTSQLTNVIQQIFDAPALNGLQDTLEEVANYAGANAQAGFQFPILEDPGPVLSGILTGQVKTMFSFTTGREHFELAPSVGFGIPNLFGVFLSAGIVFDADLSMGYDTAGLIQFVNDSLHKPADLLHGFYFDNSVDTSGPAIPNVPSPRKTALYLQGFAQLSSSAVITLSGGIYANLSLELVNPANSSHVYLDSMVNNVNSPSDVFNASGELYASAQIELTLDSEVGPSITVFKYELARVSLIDNRPLPPPSGTVPLVVIDVTGQHTLLLDIGKMSASGGVTVQPFHDMTVINGATYVADGIRVDYAGEIDLYIERKNDFTTNYYNLIGLNGPAPDGVSINIIDPFRLFKDEGAPEPEPLQTKPGVVLAGGKNVSYKYSEAADGTHANVLLAGGYGFSTLTGGTIEFGNFIPVARIDQAKQHFGDTSGFDAAGVSLLNSTIDGDAAPASSAGIIGSTMTASRGGLILGGPGYNSFIGAGPGAYEMIGGGWYNTFNISPSFGGAPATYAIDGGGGVSSLVVRVPAGDSADFESGTAPDKYNSMWKQLKIYSNAGLFATADGITKITATGAVGSTISFGDTSQLNIDFKIVGSAQLSFGGTNSPDLFVVSTSSVFYETKDHFAAPHLVDRNGVFIGLSSPNMYVPPPVYTVTRTFGTNGRTQAIPIEIGDANASSIQLNGAGASDTYNITLGLVLQRQVPLGESVGIGETWLGSEDRLMIAFPENQVWTPSRFVV